MSTSGTGHAAEVRAAARAGDHDRYLAALLAPEDAAADLMAIAAFAGETAQVPFLVSDAMLGEIRLQWWHDAVAAPFGAPATGSPVADALRATMAARGLDVRLALGAIEARMAACYADPLPDEAALVARLDAAEGNIVRLATSLLGGDCGGRDDLVREAAAALGTVRLLLDLPRHLARGRVPLPRSWLQGLDADVAAFAAPENEAARTRALAAARAFAAERLAAARRAATGLPRRCLAAFLPLALIEPQLRALTRREHDPLHDLATIAPVVRVWRLWLAHARGRF